MRNFSAFWRYPGFLRDWLQFRRLGGEASAIECYPCLFDRVVETQIDTHYFYQAIWAFRKIHQIASGEHVDIGSDVRFVGMLTCITKVVFVDIRPLELHLENYDSRKGSLLSLPFPDASLKSISCISVVEHVGLGRYGDPIDPAGTTKACAELMRVLAPGGSLLLGVPVGRKRTCFNAHRIVPATELIAMMVGLRLVSFSVVDDEGRYLTSADPAQYDEAEFANGLYHFTK